MIVYESFSSIKHVYVDSKAQFSNRYGNFSQKVSARPTATSAGTFFQLDSSTDTAETTGPYTIYIIYNIIDKLQLLIYPPALPNLSTAA